MVSTAMPSREEEVEGALTPANSLSSLSLKDFISSATTTPLSLPPFSPTTLAIRFRMSNLRDVILSDISFVKGVSMSLSPLATTLALAVRLSAMTVPRCMFVRISKCIVSLSSLSPLTLFLSSALTSSSQSR